MNSNKPSELEVKSYPDLMTGGTILAVKFDVMEVVRDRVGLEILREVAHLVAEKYVADNYQEIVKHISPEAVATLTAAEAAAKIRESLERNIPSRVLMIEHERRGR